MSQYAIAKGTENHASDDVAAGITIRRAEEEGGWIATTDWVAQPGRPDLGRQYRISYSQAGIDCEMRIWRHGHPGAWEHLGTELPDLERAIRRAEEMAHLSHCYRALYERVARER